VDDCREVLHSGNKRTYGNGWFALRWFIVGAQRHRPAMRFKAALDTAGVRLFVNIVAALEKLGDDCVLHINPKSFEFRKRPESTADSDLQAYASLSSEVFTGYDVASKAENCISMLLKLKNLSRAIKSASSSTEVVLKLTKKDGLPCFTILADSLSGVNVTQDAPINSFLTKDGLSAWSEPDMNTPDIGLACPETRSLRPVLERMKTLDKFVSIQMAIRGQLSLRVNTEIVVIRTTFQGLNTPLEGLETAKLSVRVRSSDLLAITNFGGIPHESALMCIVKEKAVIIFLKFEDNMGTMTFYCPLALDEEG